MQVFESVVLIFVVFYCIVFLLLYFFCVAHTTGVVPKKEIDVTEDEQVLRGYGDDWERLWKYPSRFVTTTIEVPIPRLFTIIFAMVLDVLIVCQLSKQVRMDELFRPFVNQLPSCFQRLIRKKFRLNLYHNSGEIMDIPNTLLMDQ